MVSGSWNLVSSRPLRRSPGVLYELDREVLGAPIAGVAVPADLTRVIHQQGSLGPSEQQFERDRRLLAREASAQAAVGAVAEAQHSVRIACDVEPIRLGEVPGVAIG